MERPVPTLRNPIGKVKWRWRPLRWPLDLDPTVARSSGGGDRCGGDGVQVQVNGFRFTSYDSEIIHVACESFTSETQLRKQYGCELVEDVQSFPAYWPWRPVC